MDLGCKPVRKRAADTVAAEHTAAAGIAAVEHTAVAADTAADIVVVAASVAVRAAALVVEQAAVQVVVQAAELAVEPVAGLAAVQVAAFLQSKPCIELRVAGIQVKFCPLPAAIAALPGLPCPAVGMCQLYLELHP